MPYREPVNDSTICGIITKSYDRSIFKIRAPVKIALSGAGSCPAAQSSEWAVSMGGKRLGSEVDF